MTTLQYLHGFGNQFQSEAIDGIIIPGRNSPQRVSHGLYAEQLSGSAFTMPRQMNLRSWLYRIKPSVVHGEFTPVATEYLSGTPFNHVATPPTQMRWKPLPYPQKKCDFIEGLFTL